MQVIRELCRSMPVPGPRSSFSPMGDNDLQAKSEVGHALPSNFSVADDRAAPRKLTVLLAGSFSRRTRNALNWRVWTTALMPHYMFASLGRLTNAHTRAPSTKLKPDRMRRQLRRAPVPRHTAGTKPPHPASKGNDNPNTVAARTRRGTTAAP